MDIETEEIESLSVLKRLFLGTNDLISNCEFMKRISTAVMFVDGVTSAMHAHSHLGIVNFIRLTTLFWQELQANIFMSMM